ncbi:hypothetical protein CEP53_000904 [Fusarium sp. AF-6]|nr:hypothetical protein CEP53_000904 [Fusarium sp. AF-6]
MPEYPVQLHIIEKKDLTAVDKVQAAIDEIYGKGLTEVKEDASKRAQEEGMLSSLWDMNVCG